MPDKPTGPGTQDRAPHETPEYLKLRQQFEDQGAKMDKLPGIMAADQALAWGRTKYRYWWTGHIHHQRLQEFPGASVESFRVLAPKDAWHHQRGYRAGRDMKAVILHKDYGETSRIVVNPQMFK